MHSSTGRRAPRRPSVRGLALFGGLVLGGASLATASFGPMAPCQALAARVGQTVALKEQGMPLDKAVGTLSAPTFEDGIVDREHAAYFERQLPGAVRFAYVAEMNAQDAAAYYLKQCRTGG